MKDILYVKELLGQVNVQNTLKYIHLANAIHSVDRDFVCKVANTVEDATGLIKQGFEYVAAMKGIQLYRRK